MRISVVFAYVVVVICLWSSVHADENIIVHTTYGDILGYQTNMARVFYGIPYAQPSIGELRWNQPVPVSRWAPRVVNATSRAPACPQPPCNPKDALCPPSFSEDCLYLNIFTPLISSNSSSISPLPVMIYIPGGAFEVLDASIPPYNAQRMVNTTNIICVFVQYRLGALGFLATGPAPNDLHGNYGILDQRLAINWTKVNIDAFGGDPNQITLFGQSAGAQSVSLHYVTSEMQPFFQSAIIQSSPMTVPFRTYDEYTTVDVLFAEQLGCPIDDFICYRNVSWEGIITAQKAVDRMITSFKVLSLFEFWLPVIDHNIVHGNLLGMIVNTSIPLKPLIIGTLTEEGYGLVYGAWSQTLTPFLYVDALIVAFPEHAFKIIERFPPNGTGDQRSLLSHLITEWIFACSTRIFARNSPSYLYVFGYPPDFSGWFPHYCDGHVCHADEVAYVFESAWDNMTDAGRRLSQNMVTYWTNFGKSLSPNQPVAPSITWPRLTQNDTYFYFQDPLEIRQDYLKADCDFWDSIEYK